MCRSAAIRPETRLPAAPTPRHAADRARQAEPPTTPVSAPTSDETPTGPVELTGSDADRVPAERVQEEPDEEPRTPTLLEQMGGASGVVASAVPVVVFVLVQSVFSALTVSLVSAIGAAVGIAVWRLVRGEAVQPSLTGLLGVAVCAFVAYRTGEAKGFFLLGIWTSLVYGGVFAVSVLVRWPLVGVVWHAVNGQGQGWRGSPTLRRAFDLATLAWVVVFGARFVVQNWLYDSAYAEAWLGWVRLAMGLPLTLLAALATIWAIRRSSRGTAPA